MNKQYFLMAGIAVIFLSIGFFGSGLYKIDKTSIKNDITTSMVSTDLLTMENFIKERLCHATCGQYKAALFSEGTTKGMKSRILEVKWMTITHKGKEPNCSYLHFVKEPGFDTYTNIILGTGIGEKTCSGDQGCFGCGNETFNNVVAEMGYTGKLPTVALSH